MRYTVDAALCAGHGKCYALAPEVFESDDEGFNAAAGQTVDVHPDHERDVRDGADSCPEQAIRVIP